MHDAGARVADDFDVSPRPLYVARTGHVGAVRQQGPFGQEIQALQPLGRAHAVLLQHQVVFQARLAAMQPDRDVALARGSGRCAQQAWRAGLDAVG
ncbi:hypothetical protein G6F24_017324 [Rhizopus arrhizus]|nr:hypothetical protein G6F24_017324 [Rhizopus arrhizus]